MDATEGDHQMDLFLCPREKPDLQQGLLTMEWWDQAGAICRNGFSGGGGYLYPPFFVSGFSTPDLTAS